VRLGDLSSAAITSGGVAELVLHDVIGAGVLGLTGVSAASIVKALDGMKSARELHVRLSSPGGNVWEGIAIYNAISRFPGRKVVHVDALAASIASVIALAGDERRTAANGVWMVHEPRSAFIERGTASDHRAAAEVIDHMREVMVGIYSSRTKLSPAECRTMMAAETWLTPEQSKAHGFTHEVESHAAAPVAAASHAAILALFSKAPADLVAAARGAQLARGDLEIGRMCGVSPAELLATRSAAKRP
jgi:ATP-dependent Clp protease protease subunit